MRPYSIKYDWHIISRSVDLWSPFKLDGDTLTSLANDPEQPYCGMAYSNGGELEGLEPGWETVRISSRATDINEPCEYLSSYILEGQEPGIYQCIYIESLSCDDCDEAEEIDDMCDHMAGWALVRMEDTE